MKQITTRTYNYNHVVSITCDICKKEYKGESWECGWGNLLETEIRMKSGTNYPEYGSGDEVEYDICPACFETKLVPFLRGLGAEPTVREWER